MNTVYIFREERRIVDHGHITIEDHPDERVVYYHNSLYIRSPFKLSNSFGTTLSDRAIAESPEVRAFITRITGEPPCQTGYVKLSKT